ncbi:ABC transporter substrate-binding protein [Paeniglutamicibacter sp. MACA_103]|uniref:ABC transporter substrate-binding protein n=1 Tax=Paeniglutamicibacter sp. MACA_103 TaxID=3377337 RepID=UPI0038942F69
MSIKNLTPKVLTVLAAGAALLLTACGGPSSAEGSADKFVYDVGSASSTVAMAPYTTTPQEMGYWKDQGLEVDVVFSKGSSAALQSVLGGSADIAVSGTNTTYSAALKNPELRIVSFTPKNVWRVAVNNDSTVQSVKDLKGKSIGVISMTSGSYMYGRSIVQAAGLNPDSDVTWLPIGDGTQATEAIESGRVEAYSSYDGPLDVVGQLTKDGLRPLESPLDAVAGSLGYVVTAKTLEERPEAIEKFLRGTYEGFAFTEFNPEAAIEMYWGQHPEQKPANMSSEEAIAATIENTENSWKNRTAVGDEKLYGYLDDASLKLASDYFTKYEIVEGNINPSETVDMSITQKANEFDKNKVKSDAENWKK